MIDTVLESMDTTFSNFLMGKINIDTFEKKLGSVMSSLPLKNKKEFEVSVVNRKQKESFFGFRIFPIQDDMDNLANSLINEKLSYKELVNKWKNIPKWYMEIDYNVFDRHSINFTPQELTAMTLHEVGHTIYSDKFTTRIYNAFKEAQVRMKVADKASMKVLYSLYMIPLSVACMQKNLMDGKNEISVEFYADGILKEYGYSDALLSALEKITRTYGSQDQNESRKSSEIATSIKWCNMNTIDLARRKDKLKDELFYQSLKSESNYFKALSFKVLNKIGVRMRERYTGAVIECTMDMLNPDSRFGPDMVPVFEYYTPILDLKVSSKLDKAWEMNRKSNMPMSEVMEGLFGSRNRKKKKSAKLPSQHELDEIMIEIDRITNHHDKIFVLDLIYDISDRLDLFEELNANEPNFTSKYAGKIKEIRSTLAMLRKATLDKNIADTQYSILVTYPKGYEG